MPCCKFLKKRYFDLNTSKECTGHILLVSKFTVLPWYFVFRNMKMHLPCKRSNVVLDNCDINLCDCKSVYLEDCV